MSFRVLIIDDEPQIRRALERALRHEGFEAIAVASGESAHAILSETPVDAILIDLFLPQISGVVLSLALMRRWPALRGRIVFMSGSPELYETEWPEELRNAPILVKPFQLEELVGVLARVLPKQGHPPREASGGQ